MIRPKGRHLATIVWLHGLGDNGARLSFSLVLFYDDHFCNDIRIAKDLLMLHFSFSVYEQSVVLVRPAYSSCLISFLFHPSSLHESIERDYVC